MLVALLVPLAPADTARAAGPWQWPVEPARVVHAFDPPDNPWESGHRGVDLAASIGQEIRAPTDGSVTFAGVIAGRGVVVVSHGEVRTTYEPVQKGVAVGDLVRTGDVLGTLQAFAHHCTSPCLHWGAIQGETYLDPTSFVVPKPSRLLPVWGDAPRLLSGDMATASLGSQETAGIAGGSGQQRAPLPDRSAVLEPAVEPGAASVGAGHRADGTPSWSAPQPVAPYVKVERDAARPHVEGERQAAAPAARDADLGLSAPVPIGWLLAAVVVPCLALFLAAARPSRRSRPARRPRGPR